MPDNPAADLGEQPPDEIVVDPPGPEVSDQIVIDADTGEIVPADLPPAVGLPPGAPPGLQPSRNYLAAVELGHVLASSGYYKDAMEPAKAAVKVMVGMDLGVSPTAALQGISVIEDKNGRVSFLIESKLLASVVKGRPGYDYRIVERTDERVEIEFTRDGVAQEPNIDWTMERAQTANLKGKPGDMYAKYPREMLTWRALAEGIRLHFPEIIGGQPVYTFEEMNEDPDEVKLREALTPGAEPLTDDRAEEQRATARAIYAELKEINPERLVPGRFDSMVKSAEHSHERLDSLIAALTDLRDTEAEIAGLIERLRAGEAPPGTTESELKALLDRVERKGSNRERIEMLRAALPPDPAERQDAAEDPDPPTPEPESQEDPPDA